MIEYHYQDVDKKGDISIIHSENDQALNQEFYKLRKFYPNVKFELINQFCLDCE